MEVGGRVETIQSTTLFKRPEYWEESWRLEESCCHSNSSERPSANADVKNSNNNNNNKHPRLITAAGNTCVHTEKQEKLENGNGKKNNCMDTSSDKLTRLHRRRPGHY